MATYQACALTLAVRSRGSDRVGNSLSQYVPLGQESRDFRSERGGSRQWRRLVIADHGEVSDELEGEHHA